MKNIDEIRIELESTENDVIREIEQRDDKIRELEASEKALIEKIAQIEGAPEDEVVEFNKMPESEHFKLATDPKLFRCNDGTVIPEELWPNLDALLKKLEELRAAMGNRAIYITSGYRTLSYNRRIGSKDTSQHVLGKAADFWVAGLNPTKVFAYADKVFANGGVGKYTSFVHVDVRDGKARW